MHMAFDAEERAVFTPLNYADCMVLRRWHAKLKAEGFNALVIHFECQFKEHTDQENLFRHSNNLGTQKYMPEVYEVDVVAKSFLPDGEK